MADLERFKDRRLLSLLEVAEYLQKDKGVIDRYRKTEGFPEPLRTFGRAYFKREELDAWAEKYRYFEEVFDKAYLSGMEFITQHEMLFYADISETTMYRWMVKKDFPKQIRAFNRILYRRAEIDEWLKRWLIS